MSEVAEPVVSETLSTEKPSAPEQVGEESNKEVIETANGEKDANSNEPVKPAVVESDPVVEKVENPVEVSSKKSVEETSQKPEEKTDNQAEPKTEEPKKKTLPKWMVQSADDANDEVVKEEEAKAEEAKKEEAETAGTSSPKKRAGRRKVDPVVAEAEKNPAPLSESRPRRSTRTNIDYANPDASTVIAEIDDEELGGSKTRRGSRRGKAPASAGRGRKRKSIGSDDEEEDEDNDADYKKPATRTPAKGRRGRPPATPKTKTPAKRGRGKKKDESEEDDEEIELDDRESEPEKDAGSGDEEVVSPPTKRARGRKPAAPKTEAEAPKRRGRPARGAAAAAKESLPVAEDVEEKMETNEQPATEPAEEQSKEEPKDNGTTVEESAPPAGDAPVTEKEVKELAPEPEALKAE